MPEISRFYGILIKMYFNEHNPPHFHAEYQGYKATITIKKGIVEGKMPKRALKLIFEWLEIHQEELFENWSTIEKTGEYNKIEPLD
ncbi:MAG: DUF4160 domain-containing protein [Bacteroidota bacterium]|nr:DUF4160 domain-containing protein [Bacteroidota bacterium]